MSAVLCPRPLRPGDRVRVVAPSGPFDHTLVWRGIGFLSERYRVEVDRGCFVRHGFLAGSDERRRAELNAALADPDLAAIIAARGGYGLSRIALDLDLRALLDHPKWLVGFSDVTVLHVEAARMGVATMHAHNAAGLGRGDAHARSDWIAALEAPHTERCFEGLSVWRAGSAVGPLFGGNLTLLFSCAAAGRLAPPPGAVWVIEDVTETAYRLDRMLTGLITAGAFDRAGAVVVGELTDCGAGIHGVPALDAVRERLLGLGVPVLAGLPVGHGRHNAPLPLGLPARVEADRLLLGSS